MNNNYLAGKIKFARYLITRADEKGFSHGEKHYLLQSALILLHEAQHEMDSDSVSILDRHQVEIIEEDEVNHIPF